MEWTVTLTLCNERETMGAVKRLYLLRHAKPSCKQSDVPDHDRPLAGALRDERRFGESRSLMLRDAA